VSTTTLYRFFDKDNRLLYVGISSRGPSRWKEHERNRDWWHDVTSSTMQTFTSRQDALRAEREAIKSERPVYNKMHNKPGAVAKKVWTAGHIPEEELRNWRIPGPRVQPVLWRGRFVDNYDFSVIRPDPGLNEVSAHRDVSDGWVQLMLDYNYGNKYRGEFDELCQIMALLSADSFGQESITWGGPYFWFPQHLNDWFVRAVLLSDNGDHSMMRATEDVVVANAEHLPDIWEPGAGKSTKKTRKALARHSLRRISLALHEMNNNRVAA
jgi:hypothetical protein